jgi:hypothetical protein
LKQSKFELITLFSLNILPPFLFLSGQSLLTSLTYQLLAQLLLLSLSKSINVPTHFTVTALLLLSTQSIIITVALLAAVCAYDGKDDRKEVRRALGHDRYYESERDIGR